MLSINTYSTVHLIPEYNPKQVQEALAKVPQIMNDLNKEHNSDLLAVVGISPVWKRSAFFRRFLSEDFLISLSCNIESL